MCLHKTLFYVLFDTNIGSVCTIIFLDKFVEDTYASANAIEPLHNLFLTFFKDNNSTVDSYSIFNLI